MIPEFRVQGTPQFECRYNSTAIHFRIGILEYNYVTRPRFGHNLPAARICAVDSELSPWNGLRGPGPKHSSKFSFLNKRQKDIRAVLFILYQRSGLVEEREFRCGWIGVP